MIKLPDTVSEYSELAAKKFLQTVVFIDDRIYDRKDGSVSPSKAIAPPKTRKKAVKKLDKEKPKAAVLIKEEPVEEYSPHDIVTSFAKNQIICALFQPQKNASMSIRSDIYSLCLSADVVIVDWDLHGDAGTKALELVTNLLRQAVEDVPEQLRLILVYTQEQNLFDIANQVYKTYNESIGDDLEPQKDGQGLAFHTKNTRVVVLGKTGRKRQGEYSGYEVKEKELAGRAISEFSKLASGMLHAAVLLGLAGIRDNSRKILSKFNNSLDAAFLTHRALSLDSGDASEQIIPLLVSQIESVLTDCLPKPLVTKSIITDWCECKWNPGSHFNELLGKEENENVEAAKIATAFCLKGVNSRNDYAEIPKWGNDVKKIRKVSTILMEEKLSTSNHQFSHLMSSRTFYGDVIKKLTLGVIVYDKELKRYLLCLQPVCDSVRIKENRVFLFAILSEAVITESNNTSHVFVKKDSTIVELLYNPKSYGTYVATFKPDSKYKQIVTQDSDSEYEYFSDKEGKIYYWIDQLKTSHAQRAVERYASELSRVGLTESEWLRLLN